MPSPRPVPPTLAVSRALGGGGASQGALGLYEDVRVTRILIRIKD